MNDETRVIELCTWVKRNRLKITDISYGSGGYSISIMDLKTGKVFTKYSWDPIDALNKAKTELNDYISDVSSGNPEDVTDPDLKSRPR